MPQMYDYAQIPGVKIMKKLFAMILFVLFVLLCGAEILPKFMASALKESGAVLYVRSADQPRMTDQVKTQKKNYQELIKNINVNGA